MDLRLFSEIISRELSLEAYRVSQTLRLLEDGATVPFVARYRKEATGGMDEVKIGAIQDRMNQLLEIEKRQQTILRTIESQGKLTDELKGRILQTWVTSTLEDLYLPYKPRRRTRAQIARERGLEPLSRLILSHKEPEARALAASYVKGEVKDASDALNGAKDIVAEVISEDATTRSHLRRILAQEAQILAKKTKDADSIADTPKYRMYFTYMNRLRRIPSHHLLALLRAQDQGILKLSIQPEDPKTCLDSLQRSWRGPKGAPCDLMREAWEDAYFRLLEPSLTNECLQEAKLKADEAAIAIFQGNLRQLLLEAPLGQKRIMGVDPGIRTGCKVVCLDSEGNLLHYEAVYPHSGAEKRLMAAKAITRLAEQYRVEAIAIGNGTASRETASFIQNLRFRSPVQAFVVSEDGASIYSASSLAREEFPSYDVTVRGAVSIARRLMDPLSELVKIDPKNLGVGQYQHDVNQNLLKECLDRTVMSCVNSVGVNLNTASWTLLRYVSGLTESTARNIVAYRAENGAFKSRKQLLKVPRLGAHTFEQCAGFLRIKDGDNPLDASAVHPESYFVVEQMAKDLSVGIKDLIGNSSLLKSLDLNRYVTSTVGLPTLADVVRELEKPGLDPRTLTDVLEFDESVSKIEDLKVGMELPGIVTNITAFGAFVDIGVHQDGLVHISEMADRRIQNPQEVVSLHQHLLVRVKEVDLDRRRISLSLRNLSK